MLKRKYQKALQRTTVIRLNPVIKIGLIRYRDRLISLPFNPQLSNLVDCCDALLTADEEAQHE